MYNLEGTLKENQKDNQIEEDLIYWEEAKKINIVNSQFVATYTEKGLEKNSKYLAISRIAGIYLNFLQFKKVLSLLHVIQIS